MGLLHVVTCSGPARTAERALPCIHRVRVVHASLHGSSLFVCSCCGGLHTSTMRKAAAATLRPVAANSAAFSINRSPWWSTGFCGHARVGGLTSNQHPRCVGGASLFSERFVRHVGPLLNALALLHVRLGLQCY